MSITNRASSQNIQKLTLTTKRQKVSKAEKQAKATESISHKKVC